MEKKKKIVFIDMDGVIADFRTAIGRPDEYKKVLDPPEMFLEGFFRNLPVMPYAKERLPELLSIPTIDVFIASKITTKTLFCATEKLQWIQKHFPSLLKRTHLTCNKGHLLGDFLIDDDIERWGNKFKGEFIAFDEFNPLYSWNYIIHRFNTMEEV
jgi:5'(3')-deoxyribonucleotidase